MKTLLSTQMLFHPIFITTCEMIFISQILQLRKLGPLSMGLVRYLCIAKNNKKASE